MKSLIITHAPHLAIDRKAQIPDNPGHRHVQPMIDLTRRPLRSYCYIFCLMFLLAITGCTPRREKTTPVIGPITESVYASAIIKCNNQYQVFTTVSATIAKIHITAGDDVKKGDVLFTLYNQPTRLNAAGALRAATYNDRVENDFLLDEARTKLELSRTRMKNDSLMLVRQINLFAQNATTLVQVEQARLALEGSKANVRSASTSLRSMERQLSFSSDQSKISLGVNRALQSDYVIRAREDGKVLKIYKEEGELATPQVALAVVGDPSSFLLEMNVDERDIALVSPGQKVLYQMDGYKGLTFPGHVTLIEPLMNELTRSFTVQASLENPPAKLYANLSAEANIVVTARSNAMTLPRSFVRQDSTVELASGEIRKVSIGLMDYQRVEIRHGLSPKDVVLKQ